MDTMVLLILCISETYSAKASVTPPASWGQTWGRADAAECLTASKVPGLYGPAAAKLVPGQQIQRLGLCTQIQYPLSKRA